MKRFIVVQDYRVIAGYDGFEEAENLADIVGRAWVVDRSASRVVAGYVPHIFGECHDIPAAVLAEIASGRPNPRRARNFYRSRHKHALTGSRLAFGDVYPVAVIR